MNELHIRFGGDTNPRIELMRGAQRLGMVVNLGDQGWHLYDLRKNEAHQVPEPGSYPDEKQARAALLALADPDVGQ